MSATERLAHAERIGGYTYGTQRAAHSPLTLADLDRLKVAVGFTQEERYLRIAGDVLADQADEMVDTWRKILSLTHSSPAAQASSTEARTPSTHRRPHRA